MRQRQPPSWLRAAGTAEGFVSLVFLGLVMLWPFRMTTPSLGIEPERIETNVRSLAYILGPGIGLALGGWRWGNPEARRAAAVILCILIPITALLAVALVIPWRGFLYLFFL